MTIITDGKPLIEIKNLSIGFKSSSGQILPVLRNVDLAVSKFQSVGIVGESGSGKSTLALAVMGYLKRGLLVTGGKSIFDNHEMFQLTRNKLEEIRGGRLALIPQNSGQALTPTKRIENQLSEALNLHSDLPRTEHSRRIVELLEQVRLPDPETISSRYPHELSGGQQQRVAIAMALAGEPEALILDEPTTGLDVTTQAHILELLRELARENGLSMVYVSHDLGAIARVCDQVVVMYAGELVLEGETREVLSSPVHPYARGLLASIPRIADANLPIALDGRPPSPGQAGSGCAFVDRCALAEEKCVKQRPEIELLSSGAKVRCHNHHLTDQLPTKSMSVTSEHSIDSRNKVFSISDLSVTYSQSSLLENLLGGKPAITPTVDDISLVLSQGETVALVGESGSGKSTILKVVAGLLPPLNGKLELGSEGTLPNLVDSRNSDQLRRIQIIFQNPDESLNPRQTVEEILSQPLRLYFGLTGDEIQNRCKELLESVRLSADYLDRLPSQLSGGERQRVAVARAFAAEPELVLCDEVTSALDVSVQAAVLDLLDQFRRNKGVAYIFVSHDLSVVRALADRVAVLYQGRLCEVGKVEKVYSSPWHPYTEVLLGAVLEPDLDVEPTLSAADIVELSPPAQGCPFQRRCPKKIGEICDTVLPPWQSIDAEHAIRCHLTFDGK